MPTEVIKAGDLPVAMCGWQEPPAEFDVMLDDQDLAAKVTATLVSRNPGSGCWRSC